MPTKGTDSNNNIFVHIEEEKKQQQEMEEKEKLAENERQDREAAASYQGLCSKATSIDTLGSPESIAALQTSTNAGEKHRLALESIGQFTAETTIKNNDNDVYSGYRTMNTAADILRLTGGIAVGSAILAEDSYNRMAESFDINKVNELIKQEDLSGTSVLKDFSATFSSSEFYTALTTGTFDIADDNGNIVQSNIEAYRLRLKDANESGSSSALYNGIADGTVNSIRIDCGSGSSMIVPTNNIILHISDNFAKNRANDFLANMIDDNSSKMETLLSIKDSSRVVSLADACRGQKFGSSKQNILAENKRLIEENLRIAGLNRIDHIDSVMLAHIANKNEFHGVKITESMRAQLMILSKIRKVEDAFQKAGIDARNRSFAARRLMMQTFKESDMMRGVNTALSVWNAGALTTKAAIQIAYRTGRISVAAGKLRTSGLRNLSNVAPASLSSKLNTTANISEKVNQLNSRAIDGTKNALDNASKKGRQERKNRRRNIRQQRKEAMQGERLTKRAIKKRERQTKIMNSKFATKHPKLFKNMIGATDKGSALLKGFTSKIKSSFGFISKVKRGVKIAILIIVGAFVVGTLALQYVAEASLGAMSALGTLTSFFRNDDDDDNDVDKTIGNDAVDTLTKEVFTFMDDASKAGTNDMSEYLSNKKQADGSYYKITAPTETKYKITDSSGKEISQTDYKNIKMIISLAEMHFCGDYTRGSYIQYCKELWDASHSYTVTYGDVYYCDDKDTCTNWGTWYHSTPEECSASGLEGCCQLIPAVGDPNANPFDPNYTQYIPEHYDPATCQGHEGCLGHVDMEIVLSAERGNDLIKRAGTMSNYDKYHPILNTWDYDDERDENDYDSPEDIMGWIQMYMDQDWSEYGVYFGISDMFAGQSSTGGYSYSGGGAIANGDVTAAYNTLTKYYGFTPAGACGFLGNLQTESHLDPAVYPVERKGPFGIVQWTSGRKSAAIAYVSASAGTPYDFAGQLDFAVSEMRAKYPVAYAACTSGTDPVYVAEAVCCFYEGPIYLGKGSHATSIYFGGEWQGLNERRNNAVSFYNSLAGSND